MTIKEGKCGGYINNQLTKADKGCIVEKRRIELVPFIEENFRRLKKMSANFEKLINNKEGWDGINFEN